MSDLARRQEALVRALVDGGPVPPGFDAAQLRIAEDALLRKRSGEVARYLSLAEAEPGVDSFTELFMQWARGRPKTDSRSDAASFEQFMVQTGAWNPPPRRQRSRNHPLRFARHTISDQ